MNPVDLMWFANRGAAVAAFAALTMSVALGLYSSAGLRATRRLAWMGRFRPHRGLPLQLHASMSLAALVALAIHIVTTLFNTHVPVSALDVVVPFRAGIAYGLGAIAFDLLLITAATGWLRSRLPQRAWRVVHSAAYICWPVALIHAVAAGTDAASPWFIAGIVGTSALVSGLLVVRLWPDALPGESGRHTQSAQHTASTTPLMRQHIATQRGKDAAAS